MLFDIILSSFSLACLCTASPKHLIHSRPPGLICKENEHFERHNPFCPITCENRYTTSPFDLCKPHSGCFCSPGFIRLYRNATGPCVPDDFCPPEPIMCGLNEEKTDCMPSCPETCNSINTTCSDTNSTCISGCKCIDNFFRNELGICIPKEKCPPSPDVCDERCIPTCANPNPRECSLQEYCECESGYIMSKIDGECIRIEDCPRNIGCNGDSHARIKQCPIPCPSTCDEPNAGHCLMTCESFGCECEPGYILSEVNGRCIPPEKCKGGYPCKVNETFVTCRSQCNSIYCPSDDSIEEILCDASLPCLSGCSCKFNYRRSGPDGVCIAAEDCPPLKCSRPNEVWHSCPSPCLQENCEEMDYPPENCETIAHYCNPRCVCKENYFRDDASVCVTPEECPYYYFD